MSSTVPQHCPSPRELDDLELLLSGALAPARDFDEPGSPITLALPDGLSGATAVELVDPEGLPLALASRASDGRLVLEARGRPEYGPFRRLYLRPDEVRARYPGRTVVAVTDAVTDRQLERMRSLGPVLLLALVGHGTAELSPVALIRGSLRVADELPDAGVVAVPLAAHGAPADHELRSRVVRAYAGDDPVVDLPPGGEILPSLSDIVDADRPPPGRRGLTLFFTGLSGSGKSTLARALMDRILEQGTRTVTSLDGDVVRRHLSAGLTFSAADRETNIARIGWVAAEIARHGGVAVCSPIAPFDGTRQRVRQLVDDAGGAFFLIHVATPLEECERRDRKGLYAKARRGEIPEFTGISSPYEEPADADLRVDTTGRSVEDALADVVEALARAGHLDLGGTVDPSSADARSGSTHAGAPAPLRVLFVCTANICRSPTMELIARRLAGPDTEVEFASAGTHGFDAQPIDPEMRATLERRGIGDDGFRSRPLTRALIDDADLVITAEAAHRAVVLDEAPAAFRKVLTLGQATEALGHQGRIGPGLDRASLLRAIGENRGPASADHDVPDPYRRSPDVAESCTAQIEGCLRVVVPRLVASARIV